MATKKATTCSRCGDKILNGLSYSHNGKAFCHKCFEEIQTELLATEEDKKVLYQYIKKLFSLTEIPVEVITGINKEISKGLNYQQAKSVLYYYYEVMDNRRGSVDYIPYVLRDQYESALNYEKETEELRKINEKVDLSHTPKRKITISVADLNRKENPRNKKKYDISDL